MMQRWAKRISLTLLVLLFAAIACWLTATLYFREKISHRIAILKSHGEPVLAGDFASASLPDDQNATAIFAKAGVAMNHDIWPPTSSNDIFLYQIPMPEKWRSMTRAAMEVNQTSLQLARHARDVPATGAVDPAAYNYLRGLANLLVDVAQEKHLQGDDDESIATLSDLLAEALAVQQSPSEIHQLVGYGISSAALERIKYIAPGLQIANGVTTFPASIHPTDRAAVQTVIATLLNDFPSEAAVRALQNERLRWIEDHEQSLPFYSRPMYLRNVLNGIDAYTACIHAARAATYREMQNQIPASTPFDDRIVSGNQTRIGKNIELFLGARYQFLSRARLAAINLATRLYRLDHAGTFPPNLDVLVPDYLPSVPQDPFSPTGAPMQYIFAENGRRPIAYGLGHPQTDLTKNRTSFLNNPIQYSSWDENDCEDLSEIVAAAREATTQP